MRNLICTLLICIFTLFCKAQTSSFTYQSANGLYCNPATVNFKQTCTGTPLGFKWDFGNGQISFAANPSINFPLAGTYTVKLLAIFENQAIESAQTIIINKSITATLTANKNYICRPGNINFTAASTGSIATYDWDFGDGNIASTSTPTIIHNYSAFGTYTAIVKTTDFSGCFASATYTVTVETPPLSGSITPVNGCIPVLVNLSASAIVPTGSSVTNYAWNFGDGTPITNTIANTTSHSYGVSGTFFPTLNITTIEGCTNTYNFKSVAFGNPPTGFIAYPKKFIYCGSENVELVAKSANANSYIWDYGNGDTIRVTDTTTTHKYATLGTKLIKVTPYFNACAGTPISFTINIIGVIASFSYSNTCSDKNIFTFTNTTQGNQSSILWNFGDGSPNTSLSNVIHSFPAVGAFTTTLSVADNITGCSDIYSTDIYTAHISLTNPDVAICKNSNTVFTIQNNYTNNAATYTWNVVGLNLGPNTSNPFNVTASIFGIFANNFVVVNNGAGYCADTSYLNHSITVRGPNLSFTAPATICATGSYLPINTSSPFIATDPVSLYYWNYGQVVTNDTLFQPPTQFYPNAGNYNVKLVGIDINGCKDSITNLLTVFPAPSLYIIPSTDTLCLGKTDTLIAFHSDALQWLPAAYVSCSTCDTTIANPIMDTKYYATATNAFGCSTTDSSLFKVYSPFTATPLTNPVYVCLNDSVNIDVLPADKKITWLPTTGLSNTTIHNPFVKPTITTDYVANLIDPAGCFSSSATVHVVVKSLPTVDAGPDKIYPYNSAFTISPIYSANAASYLWMPAGTLNCTTCSSVNGVSLETKTYTISVTSDSNCVAKDDITIFVECKYANLYMPTAFTPNDDSNNDWYYPLTRGIKLITKFCIYNRFGKMVFENRNFLPNIKSSGWNGKLNGQAQNHDTFVYILEAICDLGETLVKKGSFILLR